jgi:predicted Rdx family selenoprotein
MARKGRGIMDPKKTKEQIVHSIRMTMKREDIMTFVNGLHDVQMDMIETVVQRKEREGFPEANIVINHIRDLK